MATDDEKHRVALSNAVVVDKDPDRALVYKAHLSEPRSKADKRLAEEVILQYAFQDQTRFPARTDTRVVAEGDSWSNIIWPFSGYPPTFVDRLDETVGFYVNNIGWPGDEFEAILARKQYRQLLASDSFKYFVFSGGGNDIIGGQALSGFLKSRDTLGKTPSPNECIDGAAFERAVSKLGRGYATLVSEVKAWTTKTKLLVHGYDHAVPRAGGAWLGEPLKRKGYDPLAKPSRQIIAFMVDRFYDELKNVASASNGRMLVVDCRGACSGNWHDELHPNKSAANEIARRFLKKMGASAALVDAASGATKSKRRVGSRRSVEPA